MIAASLITVFLLGSAADDAPARAAEKEIVRHVRNEFERIGRRTPRRDSALDGAARALAKDALASGAKQAGDLLSISLAVSNAGAFDPSPRTLLVQGPAQESVQALLDRRDLARESATHWGVGAVEDRREGLLALVVLLADRRTTLEPFPRSVKLGAQQTLCGNLLPPLARAELFITRPSGGVDRSPLSIDQGVHFCGRLAFPTAGLHQVEVVGRGPKGPEVAALFHVQSGPAPAGQNSRALTAVRPPEPRSSEDAFRALLARVNGLRRVHAAPPLTLSLPLSQVAQAYSERMVREGFFAHVDPQGKDLQARLADAQIPYEKAGENLGLADGPLAAHFGIELSPGHRLNLLEPSFSQLGLGIARRSLEGREQVILTEVFSRPLSSDQAPESSALAAIAKVRAEAHLPTLLPHEGLSRLAQDSVRLLIAADDPNSRTLTDRLHDRVFKTIPEVTSAAVDVFIANSAAQVPVSANLKDPKNRLVGIGAARAHASKYGQGRYWVVVIYSATREGGRR